MDMKKRSFTKEEKLKIIKEASTRKLQHNIIPKTNYEKTGDLTLQII